MCYWASFIFSKSLTYQIRKLEIMQQTFSNLFPTNIIVFLLLFVSCKSKTDKKQEPDINFGVTSFDLNLDRNLLDSLKANLDTSGKFVLRWSNGNTKLKGSFKEGKMDGKFHSFYEDGKFHQEISFSNNMKNGVCQTFGKDEEFTEYAFYRNDTIVYYKEVTPERRIGKSIFGGKVIGSINKKNVYETSDTINFTFSLDHTMLENPYFAYLLTINNKDTIEQIETDAFQASFSIDSLDKSMNLISVILVEVDTVRNFLLDYYKQDFPIKIVDEGYFGDR